MMNVSNWTSINDDEDLDRDFTQRLNLIQGSIYIPIFCAGLANNFLTILIIALNRDMRTVTNCYLLNLAISDTLPLIVSLPFEISFFPIQVPWGHLGCQLRALLAETSTNASILTISAFTIERYLAVCRPLRCSSFSTTSRAIRFQILIWFIAILSSTPYFYLAKRIDNHCSLDDNSQVFASICFHLSATFFFVLPALILCFLYAFMAQRLYAAGMINQVRWANAPPVKMSSVPMNLPQLANGRAPLARHASTPTLNINRPGILRQANSSSPGLAIHVQSMKKSAFKMLFAVVIAFIICYAPFHVQRLITSRLDVSQLSMIQKRAVSVFFFISGILYYLGSTINPIFYHLFSRKYRLACIRTMKRLVHCRRHRHHPPLTKNGKRTASIYRRRQKNKTPYPLHIPVPGLAAHRAR